MSIDFRIQAKRQEILCLAPEHGARNARVFGSAARGEIGPDSDVDFLVAVQPEHSLWFPAGLIVDLEQLLGCEVDVVTEEALYLGIDLPRIWDIVERDLPSLKRAIGMMLEADR